jgi:3-deoxy-D-manno-octulosonic acid (KDO) 8-phosphate synthase
MTGGKENVILCERGIVSSNKYTCNTLDLGGIAAFIINLLFACSNRRVSRHGIRDLVHPLTLAGIMAGASVVLVETHPNPLIAKSDGFWLFPSSSLVLLLPVSKCGSCASASSRCMRRQRCGNAVRSACGGDKKRFFGGRSRSEAHQPQV